MTLKSSGLPAAARRRHGWWLGCLAAAATVLAASGLAGAQKAPGARVVIPGTGISGWGEVKDVAARFDRARGSTPKAPAVLILHGGGGVDGRGAFYATALQEAGIATLEITMFPPGGGPRGGKKATMPHAAAALRWLAEEPTVDGLRLGVMGFSWGGTMSVLLASELVQEALGKDTPRPAAFAPFYPTCSVLVRTLSDAQDAFYNAQTRMRAVPMLIHTGTDDDYELYDRSCDALVAMWPPAAREHLTVRYVEGATHGFDSQRPARKFYDTSASAGRGGSVRMVPSPKDASEARETVVRFFLKHLAVR